MADHNKFAQIMGEDPKIDPPKPPPPKFLVETGADGRAFTLHVKMDLTRWWHRFERLRETEGVIEIKLVDKYTLSMTMGKLFESEPVLIQLVEILLLCFNHHANVVEYSDIKGSAKEIVHGILNPAPQIAPPFAEQPRARTVIPRPEPIPDATRARLDAMVRVAERIARESGQISFGDQELEEFNAMMRHDAQYENDAPVTPPAEVQPPVEEAPESYDTEELGRSLGWSSRRQNPGTNIPF